jgi:hypothetical protein
MNPSGPLLALVLTAGCTGASMTTTLSGASPVPTPDAFTCVREQLQALEFTQTSIDVKDYRVTAKKFDEKTRQADTQFRRMVDRLEVRVAPGSGSDVTSLEVDAMTFAELTTQRGPTEVQERTSDAARTAAQALIDKCSSPTDSLSVPG